MTFHTTCGIRHNTQSTVCTSMKLHYSRTNVLSALDALRQCALYSDVSMFVNCMAPTAYEIVDCNDIVWCIVSVEAAKDGQVSARSAGHRDASAA